MDKRITKHCKRCSQDTDHRLVVDKRKGHNNYYSCSICLEKNSKKYRKKNWFKYLATKANARKRAGSVKLDEQHIRKLAQDQNNQCALTNQVMDINSKWWRPSLDRINSKIGYTLENIRLVAWIVNHTKGDLMDDEFIDMCKKVASK